MEWAPLLSGSGFAGLVRSMRGRCTPPREVRRRRVVEEFVSERLESRRLLSYSFSGGVLTFNGTTGDDIIIAYRVVAGSNDYVEVRRDLPFPTADEITGQYPSTGAGSVTKVVINAAQGNDHVYAELTGNFTYGNANFVEAMEIKGDNGTDVLEGGDGADTIQGENGNDTINGYGGDDSLHGGYAGDDVSDGSGNDVLRGGSGNDMMYGGPGDDSFDSNDGVSANDTSDGGPGTDSILNQDSLDSFMNM
jgi:Ca2+-binding RTX toxin-like protein